MIIFFVVLLLIDRSLPPALGLGTIIKRIISSNTDVAIVVANVEAKENEEASGKFISMTEPIPSLLPPPSTPQYPYPYPCVPQYY